ncbi:hypothetical protein [Candidatus Uabimicrobium amorphum]|uniref:Uncharacterized protein n=1 Tax=Uabimicrobium amorphum TaxID=2596890 RepID=A0A5S9IQJ4_UABAM|nr:hypothetical protein [Candidatus Uabimicrobium amorphum]BBM86268.1 hypothetical protein UABAM_04654 [Candidatus Uabimicrobium amorphum]
MKILLTLFLLPVFLLSDYYGPTKTVYKKIPTEMYLGGKMFGVEHKERVVTRKRIRLNPGFKISKFHAHVSQNIPTGISISGPSALYENRDGKYKVTAHFANTAPKDISNSCKWIVSHKKYGDINVGNFKAKAVPYDVDMDIIASLSIETVTFEISFPIKILKLGITSIQAGIDEDRADAIAKATANSHTWIEVRNANGFTSGSGGDTDYIDLGIKLEAISPEKRITGIAIVAGGEGTPIPHGYKAIVDLNKSCGDGTAYVYLCVKTGGNSPIEALIAAKDATTIPESGYTRINLSTNFGCHRQINDDLHHGDDIFIFVKGGNEILAIPYGNDEDYLHKRIDGYVNQKLAILKSEIEKAKEKAKVIQRELQKIETAINNAVDYSTNKWDKRAKIEKDGHKVAWGREITETDLAEILVAIGIDVSGGGGSATLTKLEEIGIESFEKITANTIDTFSLYLEETARQIANEIHDDVSNLIFDVMKKFFEALVAGEDPHDVIKEHVEGKIRSYGSIRIDIRAGVASYSGSNKLFGQTISKTFSWQPYIAILVYREK